MPADRAMGRADEITLMLAGDVMTGRGIDQVLAHPGDPVLHETFSRDARDYVRLAERASGPVAAPVPDAYPWGDALARMDAAAPDLRIVNLETALTRSGRPWPGKGIHYRMNPANRGCLAAARLDACVLANNHVLDWGPTGLHDTREALRLAGIASAGAGADAHEAWAPAVLRAGATRLLLFSVATPDSGVPPDWAAGSGRAGVARLPDLSPRSAMELAAGIDRWRRAGDRVLVSIHWGANWGLAIPDAHRAFAHWLIERAGVDAIHGHSSHHPLPVEVHRGRLILYGCGDLINDYEGIGPHGGLRSDIGCLYFVTLSASSGDLRRLVIVPLQRRRLRLQAADPVARAGLAEIFEAGPFGTRLQTSSVGDWCLRWPEPAAQDSSR